MLMQNSGFIASVKPLWEVIYGKYIHPIPFKRAYLQAKNNNSILFYPQKPESYHVLYKISHMLGYRITNNPQDKHIALKIHFEDATHAKIDSFLESVDTMINRYSTDISKEYVDKVFQDVFQYSITVNPLTYKGKCVKKSTINAMHDGEIINCPIKTREKDYVYQKFIDNQYGKMARDIRVPIFKDRIPFVYIKSKVPKNRFCGPDNSIVIKAVKEVLTQKEVKKIIAFSQKIRLDYGELDVLRNKRDGKIYIVDVNNTPGGMPQIVAKEDKKKALDILVRTFKEVFIG